MENLRLENKQVILDMIKKYAEDNTIDNIELISECYATITEEIEDSKHLDDIVRMWSEQSNQSEYYSEEEIFHVVNTELENMLREDVLSQVTEDDQNDIMFYLKENFAKIFADYFKKHKVIDERDFNECVISLSKSYNMDLEIAGVFVSLFIEENILI